MRARLIAIIFPLLFSAMAIADSGNKEVERCRSQVEVSENKDIACTENLLKNMSLNAEQKAWLYYTRGYALYHGYANYEKAVAEYTQAININGSAQLTFSSYINRAYSYLELGKVNEAEKDYEEAVKIWPKHKVAKELEEDIAHAKNNAK